MVVFVGVSIPLSPKHEALLNTMSTGVPAAYLQLLSQEEMTHINQRICELEPHQTLPGGYVTIWGWIRDLIICLGNATLGCIR